MSLRYLLALLFISSVLSGCNAVQSAAAQAPRPLLAVEMQAALTREYGQYQDVAMWNEMLREVETADVVCVGEAHYDARDMETAFEIARALASKKKIALAVERFSYDLQPALDELNLLQSEMARMARMEAVLQNETYQTVWGNQTWGQTGYPVNTPSKPVFEAMVKWAARANIPILALDVSLAERAVSGGDDIIRRNEFWKKQLEKFWQSHARENYQIVVVGGINHLTNAPDALPALLRAAGANVISIGQRDAMYQYLSSTKVQRFAQLYQLDDLIVRRPQFALVNVKGVATIAAPPDYWIVAHTSTRSEE